MWGINYMLVHLGMPVAELVPMVRISERVVLQKCRGYLEKKFVWMFGGFGWLWVLLGIAGLNVGEDCFVIAG